MYRFLALVMSTSPRSLCGIIVTNNLLTFVIYDQTVNYISIPEKRNSPASGTGQYSVCSLYSGI